MYKCNRLALDLCYEIKDMLGLGFKDLFVIQGYEKVAFFLEEKNG